MLQLSQSKIDSWTTCERQFQLRYVERSEWPAAPYSAESIAAMGLGEAFHMLVAQRILLGPLFVAPSGMEPLLQKWWDDFLQQGLLQRFDQQSISKGRVETSLAVQINEHIKLIGRVDLLWIGKGSIELFDWKTGRSRTKLDLEHDWQTRIYMALLYQLRHVLFDGEITAEQISMTYWYVREPKQSVKMSFDEAWHQQNWADLVTLAEQIENRLNDDGRTLWPLTPDHKACGRCLFNALCGRELAQPQVAAAWEQDEEEDDESALSFVEADIHPDI